jgi:hypothetical protein
MLRYLLAGALLIALGAAGYIAYQHFRPTAPKQDPTVDPGSAAERERLPVPVVRFRDGTEKAGIRFRHYNGATGQKLLPETMGSGVAFLDFFNSGRQDLLFVNSCPWPGHAVKDGPAPTLAFYRNNGDGTFTDVTREVGLDVTMYGQGITVGDYDNDGWVDVFISGVGGHRLFKNVPGGPLGRRFQDETKTAGVGGPGGWPECRTYEEFLQWKTPISFGSSAAWLDYDGDGRLDLFVCHYVTWSPRIDLEIDSKLTGAGRAFVPPTQFEGAQCMLFHNRGDGTFEDVSEQAGIQVFESEGVGNYARRRSVGKSLGIIVCDPDEDGWPDLVVANDTVRNFFFHNVPDGKGGRKFEEIGVPKGVAYAEGRPRGAMGIDWGEYRPGRSALLIANFANEPCTFLSLDAARKKNLLFSDTALAVGLHGPSRGPLKFGAFFFDYDLDGRLDLLTCNGHLEPEIAKVQPGQTYAQPAQLFWNTGATGRTFEPVTEKEAGPDLFQPLVGRGSAYADLTGDGRLSVVLTNNGGPTKLLRNECDLKHHWIRLKLEGDGQHSNRSAIGARVTLEADGMVQRREVASARGYLSQSELPVTFGLGTKTKVDRLTIRWPGKDGGETVIENPAIDQLHVVRQGEEPSKK